MSQLLKSIAFFYCFQKQVLYQVISTVMIRFGALMLKHSFCDRHTLSNKVPL